MKLTLHQTELRIFIRCIHALGKLGHELYFEWTRDGLTLKTVNSSRSAFACAQFGPLFFEKVVCNIDTDPIRFKIPSRSCTNVFKLSTTVEKTVQKCRIVLSSSNTLLVVQLFCKYGIVKTYNMTIIDCEHLEAVYSLEKSANHLVLSTKILSEILNNFRQAAEEITVIFKDGECTFQNYIFQADPTAILTQLPLCVSEFDAYLIGFPTELTFCQKELRAAVNFCEWISPTLHIHCDRSGKPIIFTCSHETRVSARFVLATLPSDAYSVPTSQRSQSGRPQRLISKTPVQVRRSTDQQNGTFNISSTSHTNLTQFQNNVSDKVNTSLANQPHSTLDGDLQSAGCVVRNEEELTLIASERSSYCEGTSRPYSVPRLRESIASPLLVKPVGDKPPPVKKIRSVLFSYLEKEEDEPEQMSLDDMNLELQQMTKRYENANPATSLGIPTPSVRTLLVADSDEES